MSERLTNLILELDANATVYGGGGVYGIECSTKAAAALADRLEQAEADRAFRERVTALFAGDPDTACRTTWREHRLMLPGDSTREECVEVPMYALSRALNPDTGGTDD